MMDQHQTPQEELRHLVATLWRRKWTVLLAVVISVIVAMVLSFRQAPLYKATARLVVREVVSSAFQGPTELNLATEAELVASQPVASKVIADRDLDDSTTSLLNHVAVTVSGDDSDVLTIEFVAASPSVAAEVANSFARSYIDYRQTLATEAIDVATESAELSVEAAQERLADINEQIATIQSGQPQQTGDTGDAAVLAALEAQRDSFIARLGLLQQRLDDLRLAEPTGGGEIIEAAIPPNRPFVPNHLRAGLIALVLGLSIGAGLALFRERLDDRFRGRPDVERALRAPVLTVVPRHPVARRKEGMQPVLLRAPHDPASEAYRNLRTNVEFIKSQRTDSGSLLVTSPVSGEGKTETAVNLAVAIAQSGKRVILVSADLRRPRAEAYFGLQRELGLTNWLAEPTDNLRLYISKTSLPRLLVMTCGTLPPNPTELLASGRFKELVGILENECDLLLFDSAPVLAVADAGIIATRVKNVLLVVDAEKSHRSAGTRAIRELENLGARVIGSVLNNFDPGLAAYPYDRVAYYQVYGEQKPDRVRRSPRHVVQKTRSLLRR